MEEKKYVGACVADEAKQGVYDRFLLKTEKKPFPYAILRHGEELYVVFGNPNTVREFREAKFLIENGISPEKKLEEKVRTITPGGIC